MSARYSGTYNMLGFTKSVDQTGTTSAQVPSASQGDTSAHTRV